MSCSEYSLEGHNKIYHLKPNTSGDKWFNAPLERVRNEMETLVSEGPSSQSQETQRIDQFILTSGVDVQGQRKGPLASSMSVLGGHDKEKAFVADVRMEKVGIITIVEEFQRMDAKEAVSIRASRARARKQANIRSSPFVPPRSSRSS
ncbi:hypothetical protein Adt_03468 [Abeliophyllum distichum]|uniref:Uncharacterized protein n=1 Tax=Abeliophyllum distichum TaxID=126358 RepID=A0ABD1R965_9LAMI